MPQILQQLSHGIGSRKFLMNPSEMSQFNVIHQVSFTMLVANRKLHAEYHVLFRICKAQFSRKIGII